MEQIAKVYSRWEAMQIAIKSSNIQQEDKSILKTTKAYQRNMGMLQKGGIYLVSILGVLRLQHSSLGMMGLCAVAATGTLMSEVYLSNKSWEKTSEIIKNTTGFREDLNIRPRDYQRMQAEIDNIRANLQLQAQADDDLVND